MNASKTFAAAIDGEFIHKGRKVLVMALLYAMPALASAGAITSYLGETNSLIEWNNALFPGFMTVEDFTDSSHFFLPVLELNASTDASSIKPGDLQPGVTYSAEAETGIYAGREIFIDYSGGFEGGFLSGGFSFAYGGDPGHPLTITFDEAVSAFGFDTNFRIGQGFYLAINFAAGSPLALYVPTSGDLSFYGFASDSWDITSLSILGDLLPGTTASFSLDNFRFTCSTPVSGRPDACRPIKKLDYPVPEPNALALLGLGLAGLAFIRRRKQ